MPDLVIIVPSRGRPLATKEFGRAFHETHTADTRLVFAVDADDPTLREYDGERPSGSGLVVCPASSNMVGSLNFAASKVIEMEHPFAIGFMGDDHRPRSAGWDKAYIEALRGLGSGIVYGNDLLQGRHLPTQCAMTADIIRTLGYMSPPMLRHLYVDNYWLDLGKGAGCLTYLPEVVVEHRHPVAGKAQWDEGYRRVNAQDVADHDAQAYQAFVADGRLAADVAKVQALRG